MQIQGKAGDKEQVCEVYSGETAQMTTAFFHYLNWILGNLF
jgi:hypothetical protein